MMIDPKMMTIDPKGKNDDDWPKNCASIGN